MTLYIILQIRINTLFAEILGDIMIKNLLLFIMLAFTTLAQAETLPVLSASETPAVVAWNQEPEGCFKCVVRSTNQAYESFVVASNVAEAEDIAVSNAARREPGFFTLIGKICSAFPGACKK